MSISLRRSMGRCSGVGSRLSVRHHMFAGATADRLSLRARLRTPLGRGESVSSWLARNTAVRDAINWQHESFFFLFPTVTNYRNWSTSDKARLQTLVDRYEGCGMQSLTDPPTNQASIGDADTPTQVYSAVQAKSWYLAYVAHALAVEMGRWVPWSLTDYSATELTGLLDSRSLFHWRIGSAYEIVFDHHGPSTPARPRWTWEFLYNNDLIGHDRLDTVARVVDWCRWNMSHFFSHRTAQGTSVGGGYDGIGMEIHWGYRGFPPVRRIVEGTTRAVTNGSGHWTAGCHGTVGFLRSVLRAANLPVGYLRRCGHALPHFMHVERYLSHGDDPYNRKAKRKDLPAADLLIDGTRFTTWFGPGADSCANIGRGVRKAVAELP